LDRRAGRAAMSIRPGLAHGAATLAVEHDQLGARELHASNVCAAAHDVRVAPDERGAVISRLLETGNADLFVTVLAQCLPCDLIARVGPVCRSWAAAAEVVLQRLCSDRRWQQARMPQGAPRRQTFAPYRALWLQRACRGCLAAAGDYAVRDTPRGATKFLLCRTCCLSERMRILLVRDQLCFDTLGLSGRPLYNESKGRRKQMQSRSAPT
jgi:hypothetical protein